MVGKIREVESDFKFVYFLYTPGIVMNKFRELCHIYLIFSKVTYLRSHQNSNNLKIKNKHFHKKNCKHCSRTPRPQQT